MGGAAHSLWGFGRGRATAELSREGRLSREDRERGRGRGSYRRYYGPLWFQAVVDRRAHTAAVNAIASGSLRSTISAISHRIARSLSVSAPTSSDGRGLGAHFGDEAHPFRCMTTTWSRGLAAGASVRRRRAHVQLQPQLQLQHLSVAVPLRRGNGSLSSA